MKATLDSLTRAPEAPASRRRFPAWSVPVGLMVGFALLFLALFRDRLLPAPGVEVAVVLATTGDGSTSPARPSRPRADGPMAFQASGWVEPDPLPIKATALVDGVVDQVHVLEGERVSKGQELATLIEDDTRLALERARESLRMREAERTTHLKAIEFAKRGVTAARAEAEAAAAQVAETEDRVDRVDRLSSGVVAEAEVIVVRSAHRRALADENAARAAVEQAETEAKRHEAQHAVVETSVKAAEVELRQAELAHSRTRIVSPVDGRVLRLLAAPGQKKMLAMDEPDSATVAILYDPARLQVRVDVPLADAAGLQIGQRARIRCSLLPDTVFHGEVTRITGEADLQRNTLQAKVRIEDPSDQLRPEMLCRVEFLQAARAPGATPIPATGPLATWIPASALDGDVVWVCDPDARRVERRPVVSGNETRDDHLRIDDGLLPGEWVVVSPAGLRDGQRVNPERIQP